MRNQIQNVEKKSSPFGKGGRGDFDFSTCVTRRQNPPNPLFKGEFAHLAWQNSFVVTLGTLLRCCLAIVALVSALSCGAGQGRSAKLKDAIFHFNEGLRWGRVQDVLKHIDPEAEAHFFEMRGEFGKNIQMTGWEITRTEADMNRGIAQVGVKITWYRLDQMEVCDTLLVQYWEEKDRRWVMTREEYQSGTPF